MRSDYPKFQAAGGEVLVVTMGSVSQTAGFRKRLDLPFRCLADPQKTAHQAYEIGRGTLNQIAGPGIWAAGAKAMIKHGVGIPVGDTRQLQGAFIIDTEGIIRFRHDPVDSADNPTNEELLAVLGNINGRVAGGGA